MNSAIATADSPASFTDLEVAPRAPRSEASNLRAERRLRLLIPAMRVGVAAAERASRFVPRPTDDPRGHAPGVDGDRILLVGAGPAVGWGVASHAVALPGALARTLSAWTGRGCTVDVIADPTMTATTAAAALNSALLLRYDGVVVVLGVNDALQLTPTDRWRQHLAALCETLIRKTGTGTPIMITGIQPIRSIALFDTVVGAVANRQAERLNTATQELCDNFAETVFVPLPGEDRAATGHGDHDRHRTGSDYARWAKRIAKPLSDALTEPPACRDERYVGTPSREIARQQAVTALDLHRRKDILPEFRPFTESARRAFGTQTALLTVLDHDRQWNLASAGEPVDEIPRELSMCEHTIHTAGGLVVRDTLQDPRFRDSPLVLGAPNIRFYAGVPIEGPGGERIGALCIIDSVPRRRETDNVDLGFLRELGHLAENALWRYLPAASDLEREPVSGAATAREITSARFAPVLRDRSV